MDIKRKIILERMTDMQSGLLRFSSRGQRKMMPVNVVASSPYMVQFASMEKCKVKFVNKPASLSQVTKNGYLFISGTVSTTGDKGARKLSMNISKAHWFEKKRKGAAYKPEEITFYG